MSRTEYIELSRWKVRRLNQSFSKVVPKSKFPAGPGGKNGWAVPNWSRRSQLIQTPNFSCTQFNVLDSAHEKLGVWAGPNLFYPTLILWFQFTLLKTATSTLAYPCRRSWLEHHLKSPRTCHKTFLLTHDRMLSEKRREKKQGEINKTSIFTPYWLSKTSKQFPRKNLLKEEENNEEKAQRVLHNPGKSVPVAQMSEQKRTLS